MIVDSTCALILRILESLRLIVLTMESVFYSTGKATVEARIGDLSIKLAIRDHDVTHIDVSGKTLEFAKYYFNKKGLNIKIITLDGGKVSLSDYYDTIICLEVIEHLPNPKEILQILASHLKEQRRLIITQFECKGYTKSNPMHFKINFSGEELLNSLGLYKSEFYPWLWFKRKE